MAYQRSSDDHQAIDLLRLDAGLLVRQYRNRHASGHQLTPEQRKAWAAEAAATLEALVAATSEPDVAPSRDRQFRSVVQWNEAMAAGRRPVTYKLPPAN